MRKPRKMNNTQVAYTRFMIIVGIFVLWIGGIGVRLVYLQVAQHDWLKDRAVAMRQDVKQTRQLRGTVFDRNGRVLAMSLRVKTLYADPTEMADTDESAKHIARVLKLDANNIANQLREGKAEKKRYIPLARKLDEETVTQINKAFDVGDSRKADLPNYAGLHWKEEQKRSYPQQALAAHIVGISNENDEGVAGIEQSQEDLLHGAVVKKLQQRDRLGRVYDEALTERSAPSDVVLTIDSAMQYMVEESLERGVKAADAKSAMAVVMSAKTGEVLALANYPTFDPNLITEKSRGNITNHAVQSVYSPGSTFKLLTYGAGLEKKLFTPTDMVSSGNGTIEIADRIFKDSHAVGTVSYSQALAHSSNVCAIKTALGVGREDFSQMVQKMGFGEKTGIELPAETGGIVRPLAKWNGDSLASISIGYEIGVSALQMTTAFATIANNGIKVRPRIIKETRKAGEAPQQPTQSEQIQVVTPETARHLRTMLKQVVMTGTGRRAQLNGYTAAGKTGTAWKFNSKSKAVDSSKYISSFIGMAPADNPEIVIGVIMDEPKSGARDGGMVAAPVFREIAQRLLHELRVPTDAPIRQETVAEKDIPETPIAETPVAGKSKTAAAEAKPSKEPVEKNKATPEKKPKENEKSKAPADRQRFSAALIQSKSRRVERYRFET